MAESASQKALESQYRALGALTDVIASLEDDGVLKVSQPNKRRRTELLALVSAEMVRRLMLAIITHTQITRVTGQPHNELHADRYLDQVLSACIREVCWGHPDLATWTPGPDDKQPGEGP